jgi:hypothetical protein
MTRGHAREWKFGERRIRVIFVLADHGPVPDHETSGRTDTVARTRPIWYEVNVCVCDRESVR